MANVRRIARHALAALALVTALSGALFIASPAQAAPAAHAAPAVHVAPATGVFCQCTTFVANSYGLPNTYPDAKYWGNWLHG
ncbi:MAG TPA: hypothetical protein VFU63_08035, partial [Ktedonobacterales bacterium]|nr:hypothetical protein [Ktedonobacterales bacterium]